MNEEEKIEFIRFLYELLANELTDGNIPTEAELKKAEDGLKALGIIDDVIFEGYY